MVPVLISAMGAYYIAKAELELTILPQSLKTKPSISFVRLRDRGLFRCYSALKKKGIVTLALPRGNCEDIMTRKKIRTVIKR